MGELGKLHPMDLDRRNLILDGQRDRPRPRAQIHHPQTRDGVRFSSANLGTVLGHYLADTRIRQALELPLDLPGLSMSVEISVGAVVLPEDEEIAANVQ